MVRGVTIFKCKYRTVRKRTQFTENSEVSCSCVINAMTLIGDGYFAPKPQGTNTCKVLVPSVKDL